MIARAVVVATVLIFPIVSPAHAHDAFGEAGPFVNGLLHPLIVPAHLLSLIGLGLWLGRLDRASLRRSIVAFPVALIAGLIAGSLGAPPSSIPLGLAVGAGGLAAAAWRAPIRGAAMGGVFAAVVIGFDSGQDDPLAAVGVWASAHLILLSVVNLAMRANAPWAMIGVRIAGAWCAAIALMLLALTLRA